MFIKIDTVDGEALDAKHEKAIQLESWAFGANNTGSFKVGTGGGAGKVEFQDLHCTKLVDSSSPTLLLKCASGEHLKEAILTVRKAGADNEDYLKITLNDVLISNVRQSGQALGDLPMEELTINFSKVEVAYRPQNADGTLGAAVKGGWDLKKNQKV